MKKIFHIGALTLMMTGIALSACMDDHDAPDVSNYSITKETSVGDTTISIRNLKEKYESVFTQNNAFTMIEDDEIVEGVVVDKSFSLIDIVEIDFGIVLILGYLNHVFELIIQFADSPRSLKHTTVNEILMLLRFQQIAGTGNRMRCA